MAMLVAGMLPPCSNSCCAIGSEPMVHTEMPCCAEPSLARAAVRAVPVTSAGAVPPVAVVELPAVSEPLPRRAPSSFTTTAAAHHEPQSPLFLLNEQFLI